MKIDNNLFVFILEKKKRGGVLLPVILCIALLAGMFGGGLLVGRGLNGNGGAATRTSTEAASDDAATGIETDAVTDSVADGNIADGQENAVEGKPSSEDEFVEGNYITSEYLASMTKDRYKEETSPYGYTYGAAISGLSRSDAIVLETDIAIEELGIEYWTEIINLYEDPELKHSVGPSSWEYDKDAGTITLYPTNYPIGQIRVGGLTTDIVNRYEHDDISFFPKDAGADWGNLSTLYLATYIDLETGEKRDVPQVQVVSFKGELPDTPRLSYSFTEDGRVHFSWSDVESAAEYFVCSLEYREEYGLGSIATVIGNTTDTEWTSDAAEFGAIFINSEFSNYKVAEDDWYDEYRREKCIAEYGETPLAVCNTDSRDTYCVIAISEQGTSMMSNSVDILDIQESIPVSLASDTWVANGYTYGRYDTVSDISAYGYVTMADGTTAMKLINYNTEKAMVVEDRYIYTDDDGNYLEGKNLKVLNIPYTIEGTPFEDVVSVVDYDDSNLAEDLKFIEEREDLLRKNAGEVALDNNIEFNEEEEAAAEVREVDFAVTANSALSEYLAINMLSGVTVIDVSGFDEAADTDFLADAFLEAYYQNPLILGVGGYRINRAGTAVKVAYDEDAATTCGKQEEIRKKISEVVAKIITDDMTELEKELVINQYLCETCEYDNAALDNAAQNNYAYVDEEFNDSFTAYGALINGRCVCAGYAAAFKLLADAAGLESVVVTGTLEGNLPHAWNKVRIDGEWEILDVTNNDNEFLVNALLNLPDEAGKRTLTEDRDYVLDAYLKNYTATNGQREYYRINDMYYDYDEIGEKLAEQINENGTALLRTEYTLDDETFNKIGQDVYAAMDRDEDLYGYYWMGVIYLTTEK
ncbi:MAG: transglutaminase domain-containing protein [Lachnospiraceae bacterium]